MINIDHEKNKAIDQVLNCLVKRINPKFNQWMKIPIKITDLVVICNICNQTIDFNYEQVYNHAINHLKEHNLLNFL